MVMLTTSPRPSPPQPARNFHECHGQNDGTLVQVTCQHWHNISRMAKQPHAISKKIFSKSIPMPDASTPAKNVGVSAAENHRFASCGSERQGFVTDKMIRVQSFRGWKRPIRDVKVDIVRTFRRSTRKRTY